MASNDKGFGVSHLGDMPITVTYVLIIAAAVVALALLRHLAVKGSVEA